MICLLPNCLGIDSILFDLIIYFVHVYSTHYHMKSVHLVVHICRRKIYLNMLVLVRTLLMQCFVLLYLNLFSEYMLVISVCLCHVQRR